jgi:uncharacterized metal-binding protein YceD (DUF177 family)
MTMTTETSPFQELYDLGDLGRGSVELRIFATGEELARIARWADVRALDTFGATMVLRKHAANSFSLDATLTADVVQDCVVTLEPVRSHVEREIHRELHLAAPLRHRSDTSIALSQHAGEDDVPEEIDSLTYDLAGPLLEELVLAIDPYPRAPGVEFAAPAEAEEAEAKPPSPFAVLKSLQKRS